MGKEIHFNNENMLEFLRSFDYVIEKYGRIKGNSLYLDILDYEDRMRTTDVTKHDYSALYKNIKLVYGDDEKANTMMYIYKEVKEKIVNGFLNIPGLERLYDEHFFEFEWDMHSRLDFDNHNISFYRDHFIHQVRNFYEMYSLYEDSFFAENFRDEFVNGNNKVSTYVKNGVRIVVDKLKREHPVSDKDDMFIRVWTELGKEKGYDSFLRELIIDYIIKAAMAMSALFHDIGYPIAHFMKLQNRISVFMPPLHMFIGNNGNGFEQIYSLLSNSLLFRMVSKKELMEQVCSGENHGAISAAAFLLTFYENGTINTISLEKRLAIEVAAVAIYDHTIKFKCIEPEYNEYYRPIYRLNPLSYHLRICDDMQEWERAYFEINNVPDVTFCDKCMTPLLRYKMKGEELKKLPAGSKMRYKYYCRCEKTMGERQVDFARRKIVDVINCKEVKVRFGENRKYILVDFDYDPFLLLKMCLIAPAFSKYRIKELNNLKELLSQQRYGGYSKTIVNFCVTPNPFILKANIIGSVLRKTSNRQLKAFAANLAEDEEDVKKLINGISTDSKFEALVMDFATNAGAVKRRLDVLADDIFIILNYSKMVDMEAYIRHVFSPRSENVGKIRAQVLRNFQFYYLLHLVSVAFAEINSKYYNLWHDNLRVFNMLRGLIHDKLIDSAKGIIEKDIDSVRALLDDALVQYGKCFTLEDDLSGDKRIESGCYYKHCKTDGRIYDVVSRYCYKDNPINDTNIAALDYYSDLKLYMELQNEK